MAGAGTREFKNTLDLIRAYEVADWGSVNRIAESFGVPPNFITETYLESVVWADHIFES